MNDDIIAKNPLEAPSIRIKGEKSTPTVPYSVNEMRYMAEHLIDIQSGMDRAWLAISISLPLRPEEVLGVTWADVGEVNVVFHIRNTVTHPARNEPESRHTRRPLRAFETLLFQKNSSAVCQFVENPTNSSSAERLP